MPVRPPNLDFPQASDHLGLAFVAGSLRGITLMAEGWMYGSADTSGRPKMGDLAAALMGFRHVVGIWGLTSKEQQKLLELSEDEFEKWRAEPNREMPDEIQIRVSHLLGIYRALVTLIPDPAQVAAWLKKPSQNPLFTGEAPLTFLLKDPSTAIPKVHALLNGRLNVW